MPPAVNPPNTVAPGRLRARRALIDTYQQSVVYMRSDCAVCRAEGFEAQAQVEIVANGLQVPAILHRVEAGWLEHEEAALSEAGWALLTLKGSEEVIVRHATQLESLKFLRAKVYGRKLDYTSMRALIDDVSHGRCPTSTWPPSSPPAPAGVSISGEIVALTRATVDVGERTRWPLSPVMDKHCVGGLPGNWTTLIIVPIVTACGVVMPKTSSRAINSPAGTADTMETLAPVTLDVATIRRIVEREGGCIAWRGAAEPGRRHAEPRGATTPAELTVLYPH